jgi:hypothetical protein
MPSHQIRVQQNNCDHMWFTIYHGDMTPAYSVCSKCDASIILNVKVDSIPESSNQVEDKSDD